MYHHVMMENKVIKSLVERRSCRSYKAEQIKDEELEAVLTAGSYAPSAMGRQPCKIIAVQNKEILGHLSRMNAAVMNSDSDPFYGAPTAVVVLVDAADGNGFQDGSCVMANMLNAAHAVGLGSCWINRCYEMFETDEGKALLKEWGIAGSWKGVAICILGYPKEEAEAKPRKNDMIIRIR